MVQVYPECYEIAMNKQAIDEEITSIVKNETCELTNLPIGAKKIGLKWIYKTKLNELGQVDKYMERLVAKVYP